METAVKEHGTSGVSIDDFVDDAPKDKSQGYVKGKYEGDILKAYLSEIGKIHLLTRDEEIALAYFISKERQAARKIGIELYLSLKEGSNRRIKSNLKDLLRKVHKGHIAKKDSVSKRIKALKDIDYRNIPVKYADKLKRMIEHYEKSEYHKRQLVEANLRLAVSIAKGYVNKGLSFLDLIQEGNLGVIRAAEKFEHEKGYKFSTYATWWIRQTISRALTDRGKEIRIPAHVHEEYIKVKKLQGELRKKYNRDPTREEVAKAMKISVDKVIALEAKGDLTNTISLSTPVGDTGDTTLGDMLPEKKTPDIEKFAADRAAKLAIGRALSGLKAREAEIIRLRFGLDNGNPLTLDEVGAVYKLTRERIRQIQHQAFKKLKPKLAKLGYQGAMRMN